MKQKKNKFWVKKVQETSFALILPEGIFTWSPKKIAQGLKDSAEHRTSLAKAKTPYQSAMSMLNFYINRAGKKLKPEDRARLEKAKIELKKLFGRAQ